MTGFAMQTKGEFSAVIRAAVHMADRFVKDAQLEIEFLPAQGEIPVLLPKQVLRQITINLVKNVIPCVVFVDQKLMRFVSKITKFCSRTMYFILSQILFSAVAISMDAGLVWQYRSALSGEI